MGTEEVTLPIVRSRWGWLSLIYASISMFFIMIVLCLIYFSPKALLPQGDSVLELENVEYLWVVCGVVVAIWCLAVYSVLQLRSLESLIVTEEFCERKFPVYGLVRIHWNSVVKVRYRLFLACIELHSVDGVIRVYNIFSDSDAAVSEILRRVPEQVYRCPLIRRLEVDQPYSSTRHPFHEGTPYVYPALYVLKMKRER